MPHRFKDEWLVKMMDRFPKVTPEVIEQFRHGEKAFLSQALVSAGMGTPEDIARILWDTYGIHFIDPEPDTVDKRAMSLVPEKMCRQFQVMAVKEEGASLVVAMPNVLDPEIQGSLQSVTGRQIVPYFCMPDRVDRLIAELLNPNMVVFDLLEKIHVTEQVQALDGSSSDGDYQVDSTATLGAPVVRLLNAVLADAVQRGASDIHLEHEENSSLIRYRMDGLLRNMMTLPKYVGAGPLVSRIKIISNLDVAEHRVPQDGRARIKVGETEIGLRISILPTRLGQKVVIRILDPRSALVPLPQLGLNGEALVRLERALDKEQGIILVTGPTGSGKTTTLYALLNRLKREDTNIVTVEDPVEYRLGGINQVQVNEKQGLTFPTVLRSVLRQDPDVVMVGEIRDRETADIALQAALTGHIVLSTLHTNDAISAVSRLADMGVERFKIAGGVVAVIAQRLVRRLCAQCRHPLGEQDWSAPVRAAMAKLSLPLQGFKPRGCEACHYSGYAGRISVVEILEVGEALKNLIIAGAGPAPLRAEAVKLGAYYSMVKDALSHVAQGDTSLEEALPLCELEDFLRLPEEPVLAAVKASLEKPAEPKADASPRLVMVEGHSLIREALGALLRGAGWDVTATETVGQGLQAIAAAPPALVVIGIHLDRGDHRSLIRSVREVIGLRDLPLISMVDIQDVMAMDRVIAETGEPGVSPDDVLPWPMDGALAVQRVRAVLARQGAWSSAKGVSQPRIPANETERLAALRDTHLLDTAPEERFDKITRLAQQVFHVPYVKVSFVDKDRQWFKSKQGIDMTETPRDVSFCAHGINQEDPFVVEDASMDARFAQNPLVTEDPHVRFYAGHQLKSKDGQNIGMFCVMDRHPRTLSAEEMKSLQDFAALVEDEIRK